MMKHMRLARKFLLSSLLAVTLAVNLASPSFAQAQLNGLDLSGLTDLSNLTVPGVDLGNLSDADLSNVDLSSLGINGLDLANYNPLDVLNALQNAIFDPAAAIAAAQNLASTLSTCPGSNSYMPCCTCESTQNNLVELMDLHRRGSPLKKSFLFGTFFTDSVSPAIQANLAKISETLWAEITTIGTFFEAQNNIRAISALQQAQAEAARHYMPSEALCRFGTLGQALAADDMNSRTVQKAIATIGLKRDIGTQGSISQGGQGTDKAYRMTDFIASYCDPQENGADGLNMLCGTDPKKRFENIESDVRYGHDVNYTSVIDINETLPITLNDTTDNPVMQDIITLSHNLYGSDQLSERLSDRDLRKKSGALNNVALRSVAATRGVAQNTYAALVGMRASGTGQSRTYMKSMYNELGLSDGAAGVKIGDKPSYYAQMEVLTKGLYQNPAFYVSLMEGKTNVERQSAAMEGLELMQDRDIYNSMRRSEMLLAVLVQLQSHKKLKKTMEYINNKGSKGSK